MNAYRLAALLLLGSWQWVAAAAAPALFFTPTQQIALEQARAERERVSCELGGWLRTPQGTTQIWLNARLQPLPAGPAPHSPAKALWLPAPQGGGALREAGERWHSHGRCLP